MVYVAHVILLSTLLILAKAFSWPSEVKFDNGKEKLKKKLFLIRSMLKLCINL